MSYVTEESMPWHEGEDKMHRLTKVEYRDNPNSPFLSPGGAHMLQRAPLLAIGALDKQGRPWTTIWGGETPLAQQVARSIIGIRTIVDSKSDPVIETLFGGKDDGEVVKEEGSGRMISGLTIDLEKRQRVKLFGRMIAGALSKNEYDDEEKSDPGSAGQVQLVIKIEQSLANCPKYLNCKRIYPALPEPKLVSNSTTLPKRALDLLGKADMFFISSADHDKDMDSNHRGGPPGFVRVQSNTETETVLVWPEYSGNNLYQTLGNLQVSPQAGLVSPDFETGDVLYVTGTTEVLIGKEASAILPRSNLAVKLTITGSRLVEKGLPFRGQNLERSPYNPNVRYLATEKAVPESGEANGASVTAKLIKTERLTPTILRFRFSISDPDQAGKWKPGQYAALSFYDELYMGYSHMRDDDPKSLNDDFLRTWTISSHHGEGLHGEEFEMTIRKVGNVTRYLSMQNARSGLEVPLKGFGGDFFIKQKEIGILPYIAGGIGITPLLAQLPDLDISRLRLFWTLNMKDIGLVKDTFKRFPSLQESTTLFLTGSSSSSSRHVETIAHTKHHYRRMQADDFANTAAADWYICTGPALRASILQWLAGKNVFYEDFGY